MIIDQILEHERKHRLTVNLQISILKTVVKYFNDAKKEEDYKKNASENLLKALSYLEDVDRRAGKAARLIFQVEEFEAKQILDHCKKEEP